MANGNSPFDNLLAQLEQMSAGGGGTLINPYQSREQANQRYVWMGKPRGKDRQVPSEIRASVYEAPLRTVRGEFPASEYEKVAGLYYWWSDEQWQKNMARASELVGQPINSKEQFQSLWAAAVDRAASSWESTGGRKPITPWQAMEYMKSDADAYGDGKEPVTTTSRTTTVNKLSDGSAWQILKSAAQQALGRNPTHEELRSFASRANRIAVENPDVSTVRTTVDADGNSSSSATRQQGAGADDFLTEAETQTDTEEAGAYQAATTYYQAMISGLNSVV